MRERIECILKSLSAGAYERDEAIALSLLAGLSGESIFMLGLPGVGKSMIARKLKLAFSGARVFEYLMSRFSTPDEIFGPVSISKLKNEDCYERITSGYLPEAEVVFLDEIWKAGPAIQNSMLTVLNEKIFLNGNRELRLPTKAIIAASNELPAEGEGLEALWDRFLLRYIVEPIHQKENFFRLLDAHDADASTPINAISNDEYYKIQANSRDIALPRNIKELLFSLRQRLNSDNAKDDNEDGDTSNYYVSDRRWRKTVNVMKTSAYLNGRSEVTLSDTLLLGHMLWNNDAELAKIRYFICETVVGVLFADLLSTYSSLSKATAKPVKKKTFTESQPYTQDNIHYDIICDDSILRIRISDYVKMKSDSNGFFYGLETTDGVLVLRNAGQFSVRVPKPGYVCINGYNYQLAMADGSHLTTRFLNTVNGEIDKLETSLNKDIASNIFVRDSEIRSLINSCINDYRKRFSASKQ